MRHLEAEPPRQASDGRVFPTALNAVLEKAMAKDREQRYASCSELVAERAAACSAQTSHPQGAGASRLPQFQRRWPHGRGNRRHDPPHARRAGRCSERIGSSGSILEPAVRLSAIASRRIPV